MTRKIEEDRMFSYYEDSLNSNFIYQYHGSINVKQNAYFFKIRKITSLRFKDILMSFLLHLNEDLDDDLLSDAIELIVKE